MLENGSKRIQVTIKMRLRAHLILEFLFAFNLSSLSIRRWEDDIKIVSSKD